MSVDCLQRRSRTGRRTHFYSPRRRRRLMTPEHFDFSRSRARILHLGLPGAHARHGRAVGRRRDRLGRDAAAPRAGRARDQSRDDVDDARESRRARRAPCLPHLDLLIVNDFEIGALADIETRDASGANPKAIARAVDAALSHGRDAASSSRISPKARSRRRATAGRFALGSVAMPKEAIAGVNGAGDAFAAGMLYGWHEGWPIEESLRLAHACAAASMRAVSTTAGVAPVAECLALAENGLRPAPA